MIKRNNNKLKNNKKPFKILSIDGGGLKGIFTIYAVLKLKEEYDIDLFEEFDMFVGTSTGAIIVASILLKADFNDIYNSYAEKPNKIFYKRNELLKQINKLFLAKFDNSNLMEELNKKLGDITFDDLDKIVKKPYIFTATNISEAKPIVFCSKHFESVNRRYMKMKLRDAVYSSSAAPLYFEPIIEEYTNDIIADGGIWANNPAITSLVYAFGDLNKKIDEVFLLSFGQTSTQNIKLKLNSGFKSISSSQNNQASALFTSSIASRQNFDTLASIMILKDRMFRYSPEKNLPGNKVDKITNEYIEYTKQYWEENKEKLVKFIKEGVNEKHSENLKKLYN